MQSLKLFCILFVLSVLSVVSAHPTRREKRIFSKAFKAVTGGVTKGVGFVKDTADDAKKAVTDVADDAKKAVKGVADGVKDGVTDIADDVKDGVTDIADDVKDGVTDAAKYTAKVGKKIVKGAKGISKEVYKEAYDKAKKTFEGIKGLAGKVDFDDAVDILTDMIDSELTNSLCEFSCIGAAVYVLGPAGELYGEIACPPLCAASLAKLEDVAG